MSEQLSFGRPALLEDTPENREFLRHVLWSFRQRFQLGAYGPGEDRQFGREVEAWARDQHHRLMEPRRKGA